MYHLKIRTVEFLDHLPNSIRVLIPTGYSNELKTLEQMFSIWLCCQNSVGTTTKDFEISVNMLI